MKYENEVTVIITESKNELISKLTNNNFKLNEEYIVNDIYFSKDDKIIKNEEFIKNCLLVREIITKDKIIRKITHKYKEIDENGNIIKNGKLDCIVNDKDEAINLLLSLGYSEIVTLNDKISVYSNEDDELMIQEVNDKYLYVEIEENCEYINKKYEDIEEMKNVFNKYDICIKENEYFVKKILIALNDKN